FIDRRIPEFSPTLKDAQGNPANLHKYLAVHETDEAARMRAGEAYPQAHIGATAAERAAVVVNGVDWAAYTHEIDGYLDHIEHEKPVNPPPGEMHVDPEAAIGHHRAENKPLAAKLVAPRRGAEGYAALVAQFEKSGMIENAEAYAAAAMKRRERAG